MTPQTVLTRYTSFARFYATVTQGLFLPKATLFEDQLEGVLPYFRDPGTGHVISRETIRACLDWVYASCWHCEPYECYAMWRIYGASKEAVALQTTVQQLRLAYLDSGLAMHSYLDEVRYTSPEQPDFKVLPTIHVLQRVEKPTYEGAAGYAALFAYNKHEGYRFEHEARLVAIDARASSQLCNPKAGCELPGQLTRDMITGVLVHPEAPTWFIEAVRDVSDRWLPSVEMQRSSMVE